MVSIDVGGKLLTNHLKKTVSYRQWNMMEETHIMNEIKEACCYVSEDFEKDLETCRYVSQTLSTVRVRDGSLTMYPVFFVCPYPCFPALQRALNQEPDSSGVYISGLLR